MRMGDPELSELAELGGGGTRWGAGGGPDSASWTPRPSSATRSNAHQLARYSRSQQDNRRTPSYEAEDAGGARVPGGSFRSRPGQYYSPPGTSYTIVERPASSHGHHPTTYSQHQYQAKLTRGGYMGSATNFTPNSNAPALRNSTNHLNGKKRPISPEQVLRLFGQNQTTQLSTAKDRSGRRLSPASSPSSTTHQPSYRGEPRSYSAVGAAGGISDLGRSVGLGASSLHDLTTRTVTMSRDPPDGSHGFGICVKGGKEAGVGVYISRVEDGSVAERSGLRPGDSILQVNGTPFTGISHEEALKVILKMLKSCKQLSMTVRSPALGTTSCPGGYAGSGTTGPRASCSWMDRQGRPASPPPAAHSVPPQLPQRYGGYLSRSTSKDRSIRRVDLCIEPGQSLGLMIRGGLEYNLGIYITGVDKESVAERAGLMIGDQILEVNGQSFLEVTHDEAVAQLKYHKRMSLLVKDVGKVPHSCTAYGDRGSHELQTCDAGSPSRSFLGVRSAAAAMVEEKARSLLATGELPALVYHMDEYISQRLKPDHFVTVVLEMLNTPDKYTLLTELREFMHPEDRSRFDELVYRRELGHDHHVRRKGGTENHYMMMSSTMHELHAPELTEASGVEQITLEHRSPSEDSGLGLAAHDLSGRQARGQAVPWSRPPTDHMLPEDESQDAAHQQEYCSDGSTGAGRRSRRHSSPANSREGSTTALHQLGYEDSELAHKLSRSFDMKEESGTLLGDGAGSSGIRRHQSMQRLQAGDSMIDEQKGAKVISDHHGNLHITVKKTKPILGIAIEGGANTKHPLPRIINIHEHGAAHAAGGLEVGQLILAVDGRRVDGMPHQDVAKLIAEAFAQRDKPEIEFLVVEAKKSNLEPKPTALIFLEA